MKYEYNEYKQARFLLVILFGKNPLDSFYAGSDIEVVSNHR